MFQDITGATQHLRHAKGLDQMITVSKSGLPVDISKVGNIHSYIQYIYFDRLFICLVSTIEFK